MTLRYGPDLDDEVDEIVAALQAADTDSEPVSPAPRRRSPAPTPQDPAADVPRETSAAGAEGGDYAADPDPGYGYSLADRIIPDTPAMSPPKITQAVRKDIRAKVAMLLGIVAAGWEARDPHCGGALGMSIPDQENDDETTSPGIATALTDIFCDSPDIVNWFTTSGKYMKWLTLAMTLQSFVSTVIAHHITHRLRDEGTPEPDWSVYATH